MIVPANENPSRSESSHDRDKEDGGLGGLNRAAAYRVVSFVSEQSARHTNVRVLSFWWRRLKRHRDAAAATSPQLTQAGLEGFKMKRECGNCQSEVMQLV
jgi:hypothetical protein